MPFLFTTSKFVCTKEMHGEMVQIPCSQDDYCHSVKNNSSNEGTLPKNFNLYCEEKVFLGISGSLFFVGWTHKQKKLVKLLNFKRFYLCWCVFSLFSWFLWEEKNNYNWCIDRRDSYFAVCCHAKYISFHGIYIYCWALFKWFWNGCFCLCDRDLGYY